MEEQKKVLNIETTNAISTLARAFRDLTEDAKINTDDVLETSRQKLQIDVRTMEIDQAARKLLTCIRRIKELKVTDNSFQDDRERFEAECVESTAIINQQVKECYEQLTKLSNEGFDVLQDASKLLR